MGRSTRIAVDAGLVLAAFVSLAVLWKFLPETLRPTSPDPAFTAPVRTPLQDAAPPQAPPVAATVAPVEAHVTPAAPAVPEVPLDESDNLFRRSLSGLMGTRALGEFFVTENMVRRFVATVDNLPRQEAPMQVMPVKPMAGAFLVDRSNNTVSIAPANTRRYVGFIDAVSMVNLKDLVALYDQHYTLFQQAYRDLGYPKGNFNDRLMVAIEDLLATVDLPGPMEVHQPKVLYEFADPDVEVRSAGQKMMTRIGKSNAQRLRKILQSLQLELKRSPPSSLME